MVWGQIGEEYQLEQPEGSGGRVWTMAFNKPGNGIGGVVKGREGTNERTDGVSSITHLSFVAHPRVLRDILLQSLVSWAEIFGCEIHQEGMTQNTQRPLHFLQILLLNPIWSRLVSSRLVSCTSVARS